MKSSWIGIGFSHHRVPSLSNTATRSSGGTAVDPASPHVRATKFMIACLAGPSRQLESSPVMACPPCSPDPRSHTARHQQGHSPHGVDSLPAGFGEADPRRIIWDREGCAARESNTNPLIKRSQRSRRSGRLCLVKANRARWTAAHVITLPSLLLSRWARATASVSVISGTHDTAVAGVSEVRGYIHMIRGCQAD